MVRHCVVILINLLQTKLISQNVMSCATKVNAFLDKVLLFTALSLFYVYAVDSETCLRKTLNLKDKKVIKSFDYRILY